MIKWLMRKIIIILIAILLIPCAAQPLSAQAVSINLKSAPPDLAVHLNGELQRPVSSANGIRNYRLPASGTLSFSAAGYMSQEFKSDSLPTRHNQVHVKLENEKGILKLVGEYKTGIQPKSAYFSPDGKRLFVPLLLEHGTEVFRFEGGSLVYEKRLTVPGSKAVGNVEIFMDERRRELWISNMEENKAFIYNLDTLEYKMTIGTGGNLSKVIIQNPKGDLTLISNWVTQNISVFNSDTKELLRRIPIGGTPRGMAFSPDGNFCYVANYDRPQIAVIDMRENKVTKRFPLNDGEGAVRHVIYHDGKLFVSDMYRGTVNIMNASTGAVLVQKRIGPNINTIVLTPDGKYVFASSRGRNNPVDYTIPGPEFGAVYMLNAEDLSVVERVWGRNQPTGLAVSPDGKYLAFTDFLDANLELYTIR